MARITKYLGIGFEFVLHFENAYTERAAVPLIKLVPHGLRVVINSDTWGFRNAAYLNAVIQAFVKTGNTVNVEQQKGTFIEYSPKYPQGNFALYNQPAPATQPASVPAPAPAPVPTITPAQQDYSTPVSVPFVTKPPPKPRKKKVQIAPVTLGVDGDRLTNLKIVVDSVGALRAKKFALKQGKRVIGFLPGYVFGGYVYDLEQQEKKNKEAFSLVLDTSTRFAILGIPETTTDPKILRKAWITRLQEFHPDKMQNSSGSHEATIVINDAYAYLKDDQKRARYALALSKTKKLLNNAGRGVCEIRVALPGFVSLKPNLIYAIRAYTLVCDAYVNPDLITFTVSDIHSITPTIKDGKVFIIGDGWVDGSQYGV